MEDDYSQLYGQLLVVLWFPVRAFIMDLATPSVIPSILTPTTCSLHTQLRLPKHKGKLYVSYYTEYVKIK